MKKPSKLLNIAIASVLLLGGSWLGIAHAQSTSSPTSTIKSLILKYASIWTNLKASFAKASATKVAAEKAAAAKAAATKVAAEKAAATKAAAEKVAAEKAAAAKAAAQALADKIAAQEAAAAATNTHSRAS